MTTLTIFEETGKVLSKTDEVSEITKALGDVGVFFTRWPTPYTVTDTMSSDEIMKCYQSDIQYFFEKNGYQKADVVSMTPEHPQKQALREKFLSEHTHAEDEIRFFVRGEGLFTLHIENKIYSVLCRQNDLISIPAGTKHWFDMGDAPTFTAIRFFNTPDWVAHYTGSDIARGFPKFEPETVKNLKVAPSGVEQHLGAAWGNAQESSKKTHNELQGNSGNSINSNNSSNTAGNLPGIRK